MHRHNSTFIKQPISNTMSLANFRPHQLKQAGVKPRSSVSIFNELNLCRYDSLTQKKTMV